MSAFHRTALVHGLTGDIEDATHHTGTHGHGNRGAGVVHFDAALETFGAGHRDGPHPVVTEVLLHFERQLRGLALQHAVDGQGVVDTGQGLGKLHVHDRAGDLNDSADVHRRTLGAGELGFGHTYA